MGTGTHWYRSPQTECAYTDPGSGVPFPDQMYVCESVRTFAPMPHLGDYPYNRCSVGSIPLFSVGTASEIPNQNQKVLSLSGIDRHGSTGHGKTQDGPGRENGPDLE